MRVSAVHSPAVTSEIRSKSSSRIPKPLCCVKRTPTPSGCASPMSKDMCIVARLQYFHAKFNKRLMRHCYRESYKWPRMLWAWEELFNTTPGDKGFTWAPVAYEKRKQPLFILVFCLSWINYPIYVSFHPETTSEILKEDHDKQQFLDLKRWN